MPDPNLCQNNPECLHQSSLDIERPGGVSDLGLGKVGVWGGLQGLGSAREQSPQNLEVSDPTAEGEERADSPHTP